MLGVSPEGSRITHLTKPIFTQYHVVKWTLKYDKGYRRTFCGDKACFLPSEMGSTLKGSFVLPTGSHKSCPLSQTVDNVKCIPSRLGGV